MSNAGIDSAIRAWTKRHCLTLFDGLEGKPDHSLWCIYVSNVKGECFQIWIDPPERGEISIHAADVETHLDKEFRQDWRVPLNNLDGGLENALRQVKEWMER